MSHTLHRAGDRENLACDYVVFSMSAKGYNEDGSGEKLREFLETLLKYKPVNYGDMLTGNCFVKSEEEIVNNISSGSIVHTVFTDPSVVTQVIKELKEKDLGMSVIVTGLHEETAGCCREGGIRKHTVEHSLGIFGQKQRLPSDGVLQLTTMCGHAMVSVNLVNRVIVRIKKGKMSFKEAAIELTRQCHCGIYNPYRAEKLLRKLVPLMTLDP